VCDCKLSPFAVSPVVTLTVFWFYSGRSPVIPQVLRKSAPASTTMHLGRELERTCETVLGFNRLEALTLGRSTSPPVSFPGLPQRDEVSPS